MRRASKRELLDRAIGRAVSVFNDLLSEAQLGKYADSLKLQKHLNEVSNRAHAISRSARKKES